MVFKFKYDVSFDRDKSTLLKETRGMSFEDLLDLVYNGNVLDDIEHNNPKKHPNQNVLIIKTTGYVYAIPYVIDDKKKMIFLKTAYPSHNLTKKYAKNKIR
ncbi:MAG: toxin [Patescibacteria group bacterium]